MTDSSDEHLSTDEFHDDECGHLASPPPAAPSLREALERLVERLSAGDVPPPEVQPWHAEYVAARAALASPEPAPDLIERAIAAACPDPAAHDEAAVTEGRSAADWHRYLHAEGILVADDGITPDACGPWHHRVFMGGPAVTEGLDVERLDEALRNYYGTWSSYETHAVAAEYARLSAEQPDTRKPAPNTTVAAVRDYMSQGLEKYAVPAVTEGLDVEPGATLWHEGHRYVHVAACPCPATVAEVARLSAEQPDSSASLPVVECPPCIDNGVSHQVGMPPHVTAKDDPSDYDEFGWRDVTDRLSAEQPDTEAPLERQIESIYERGARQTLGQYDYDPKDPRDRPEIPPEQHR